LHLGGQHAIAQATLDAAGQRPNADPWIAATRALIAAPDAPAPAALLRAPARFAPYWPDAVALPRDARRTSAAVALSARQVLAPAAGLTYSSPIVLRDQRGRLMRARVERMVGGSDLALLRADADLDCPGASAAVRMPFPGAPAYTLAFGAHAEAQWPRMSVGFLGRHAGLPGMLRAEHGAGASVWAADGSLIGITFNPPGGGALLALAAPLRAQGVPVATPAEPPAPRSPDAVYEAALRCALEVLVMAPDEVARQSASSSP
jgi:hypothetical protein